MTRKGSALPPAAATAFAIRSESARYPGMSLSPAARDALGLLGQIEPEFEETLAERPRSRHPHSQILDPSSNRGELTSRERLQAPFDLWLQLDRPW
jgi:hypothetical protein